MAKVHDEITPYLRELIEQQHIFFVATAPLSGEGHVNLSPKGLDCFRILSPLKVVYLDLTGSGNETSAHLLENGRITFMFCTFDGPPNIVRFYGKGHAVIPNTPEWEELAPNFKLSLPGVRQIIVADIERVQTSCGYGVPLMEFVGERDQIQRWVDTKGEASLDDYRRQKNTQSIDCLPTPLFAK
ncbi:MAG: pyridoxamine 5'-phosphate oxidase family protein [Chloroflexi bacterium]|nr:pyridoxamine 5'-phosphate oxidase family protein [Chloroflexota bacterium]